jgi:hypothetical protein
MLQVLLRLFPFAVTPEFSTWGNYCVVLKLIPLCAALKWPPLTPGADATPLPYWPTRTFWDLPSDLTVVPFRRTVVVAVGVSGARVKRKKVSKNVFTDPVIGDIE